MQSLLDSERKTIIPLYFCTDTRITLTNKRGTKLEVPGHITRNIYDFNNEGSEIDISIENINYYMLYTITYNKETIEKCLRKREDNDGLACLTMVYKLDQGTYIKYGFDVFKYNNGYDRNIYIGPTKDTTYKYVNPRTYLDFLMIPEISDLPWQYKGYYKCKTYKLPRWFKKQHKNAYNDPIRHGGVTFMWAIREIIICSGDYNNKVSMVYFCYLLNKETRRKSKLYEMLLHYIFDYYDYDDYYDPNADYGMRYVEKECKMIMTILKSLEKKAFRQICIAKWYIISKRFKRFDNNIKSIIMNYLA